MEAVERGRRRAHDSALDLARPARRDQLAAERAEERLSYRRAPQRSQAFEPSYRRSQEGVAGEALQELRMVVVEPQREPHAFDRLLPRRADEHDAVRQLSRLRDLQLPVGLVNRPEDAAGCNARGVAAVAGGESEGVGPARSERGLDQLRV